MQHFTMEPRVFFQHLRDEFDTTEKDGLKLTTGIQKAYLSPKTNETEKQRRLLIIKERTLDALEP